MIVFTEVVPKSYSVETGGNGLYVTENIAAAAEITLISPNYNYFRYPSAILNFSVKEASGEVGI